MSTLVSTNVSCGIREFYDIPSYMTPESFLVEFLTKARASVDPITARMYPNKWKAFRFLVFSHRSSYFQVCNAICEYIKENKLGKIVLTEAANNPNSGNDIKIYIWQVDWEPLLAWEKEWELKTAKKVAAEEQLILKPWTRITFT